MNVYVLPDQKQLGIEAGKKTAELIRKAIKEKGNAIIILATGSSQFETLKQLIDEPGIAWDKVTMFHLDEYIGLPVSHKASFRKYLKERFLDKVPPLQSVNLINGETNPGEELRRLNDLISSGPVDVALVGIGENGHLAFNDPPADFETSQPYIIASLDQACRQQQVNEQWFGSVEEVPAQAISMSVRQIMQSEYIICSVPGARKARAVKDCLEQPVSNLHPASILQDHPNCCLFLDKDSASLLKTAEHA
ncbi:MAG: glucosamine-6-phosphate deaminase [Sphingobacteriales bacterium]|nr:glucosamine-6-phosphate deaminase [Sphingobacteriales bacterium]OJY90171.1 MAG: glucosamine-6-phosphate deaminase [Sphingobacteriales bacterium 44-15]